MLRFRPKIRPFFHRNRNFAKTLIFGRNSPKPKPNVLSHTSNNITYWIFFWGMRPDTEVKPGSLAYKDDALQFNNCKLAKRYPDRQYLDAPNSYNISAERLSFFCWVIHITDQMFCQKVELISLIFFLELNDTYFHRFLLPMILFLFIIIIFNYFCFRLNHLKKRKFIFRIFL